MMSRNLRVFKQSELASRDTASPHFGGGLQKIFFRPSLGENTGKGGGGAGSPSPSSGSATDKYLGTGYDIIDVNEFYFNQTG